MDLAFIAIAIDLFLVKEPHRLALYGNQVRVVCGNGATANKIMRQNG